MAKKEKNEIIKALEICEGKLCSILDLLKD